MHILQKSLHNNINFLSQILLWGDFTLTIINCSCDCKYQIDGKCHLDNVQNQKICPMEFYITKIKKIMI